MIRLEMRNFNIILKEKQQKCQYYHQVNQCLSGKEIQPSG